MIALILQSTLLLFPDLSLGVCIPSVSAASSVDAAWNQVQPFVVTDDSQGSFWTVTHSGVGSIIVNISDDSLNRKSGEDCLKIVSKNGTYKYFDMYHEYRKNQNFYPLKYLFSGGMAIKQTPNLDFISIRLMPKMSFTTIFLTSFQDGDNSCFISIQTSLKWGRQI